MVSGRSPAYPYIDLGKAVENAKKIHSIARGHDIDVESLFKKLGFNGMTGSARKTLAAMKYYGLLDQAHGSKDTKLSKLSMHIIHGVEGSDEQKDAIKEAFLSPLIYQYCWETWGDDEIDDALMKSHLILKKGFNDSTVMGFISNYKASRDFADIAQNDEIDYDEEDKNPPKIGDFIQWESQGVFQFPKPKRVRDINMEEGYLFVEGSLTEIPVDEAILEESPAGVGKTPPPPGVPGAGVIMPPHMGVNMRQETFTLSDSEILIQFPSTMSEDDFEDFEGWLEIFKRKVRRSIKSEQHEENE